MDKKTEYGAEVLGALIQKLAQFGPKGANAIPVGQSRIINFAESGPMNVYHGPKSITYFNNELCFSCAKDANGNLSKVFTIDKVGHFTGDVGNVAPHSSTNLLTGIVDDLLLGKWPPMPKVTEMELKDKGFFKFLNSRQCLSAASPRPRIDKNRNCSII